MRLLDQIVAAGCRDGLNVLHGVEFEERTFELSWDFTQSELVAYLMTHSNTLVATQSGESSDEIRAWLGEQLHTFFDTSTVATVAYEAWYAILKPN